jgi:hypothetical protein
MIPYLIDLVSIAVFGGIKLKAAETGWTLSSYIATAALGTVIDIALYILAIPHIWVLKIAFKNKMILTGLNSILLT